MRIDGSTSARSGSARMAGRRHHRPDAAAARAEIVELRDLEAAALAIETHAGARRAADRRHRRLWRVPRHAGRCLRRGAGGAYARLLRTRPTAVNLRWALDRMRPALRNQPRERRVELAYAEAAAICDEDVAICRRSASTGWG